MYLKKKIISSDFYGMIMKALLKFTIFKQLMKVNICNTLICFVRSFIKLIYTYNLNLLHFRKKLKIISVSMILIFFIMEHQFGHLLVLVSLFNSFTIKLYLRSLNISHHNDSSQ